MLTTTPDTTDTTNTNTTSIESDQPKGWRALVPVHPAAELFPLMPEAELRELGENIKALGGLIQAVHLHKGKLLDGRNRLDAAELVGFTFDNAGLNGFAHHLNDSVDPYDYVMAANLHRRHLTADQRRDLIAKVLKAKPEASNATIAKQTKADDKTVAKVRRKLESTSEIPKLDKTVGKDGKARKRPANRKPRSAESEPSAEDSAAARRAYYTEQEGAAEPEEPTEDIVAAPEVIEGNILHTLERAGAIASATKKILKVSSLDREAKARVSEAIERLIVKWRSTQATLGEVLS